MDVTNTQTVTSFHSDTPTQIEPTSVKCPDCDSNIGEKCKTGVNQWVEWFHLSRVKTAFGELSIEQDEPIPASVPVKETKSDKAEWPKEEPHATQGTF